MLWTCGGTCSKPAGARGGGLERIPSLLQRAAIATAPADPWHPRAAPHANAQVAHAIPWIVLLSQMAYYSKLYGPQVRKLTSALAARSVNRPRPSRQRRSPQLQLASLRRLRLALPAVVCVCLLPLHACPVGGLLRSSWMDAAGQRTCGVPTTPPLTHPSSRAQAHDHVHTQAMGASAHTHTHAHKHTHARTHAHTHTHTCTPYTHIPTTHEHANRRADPHPAPHPYPPLHRCCCSST